MFYLDFSLKNTKKSFLVLLILSTLVFTACEENHRDFGGFLEDKNCTKDSHCKNSFFCKDGYCEKKCEKGFQDNDKDGTCEVSCDAANLNCDSSSYCSDTGGVAECVCPEGEIYNNTCVKSMVFLPEDILPAYKMDVFEVTVSQFRLCVKAGKCSLDNFKTNSYNSSYNYGNSAKNMHPMNGVNWFGAREYCLWAGKRLPKESEWLYAAYGKDGRNYPWGNEEVKCDYATYSDCGALSTSGIGTKPSGVSPFGLHDMAGNVFEWLENCYGGDCSYRILRGGSWNNDSYYLQSSYQYGRSSATRNSTYGFRCAESL